jgi:hypothetical protein
MPRPSVSAWRWVRRAFATRWRIFSEVSHTRGTSRNLKLHPQPNQATVGIADSSDWHHKRSLTGIAADLIAANRRGTVLQEWLL